MEGVTMEQKMNEYLSVRLVHGLTEVFVGEKRINQCKLVLMNFPRERVKELGRFETIDELSEFAEKKELDFTPEITPEEEFWAHCSAIQAWVEAGYDTRLLDMRLAFPILKELTKVGDKQASQKFKDEIFKRFNSAYAPVIKYLTREGYLEFLDEEEIETLFKATDTTHITKLDMSEAGLKEFPSYLLKFKALEYLELDDNEIEQLPPRIGKMKHLKELIIINNRLKHLPNEIGELSSLESLDVRDNQLAELPDSIGNLKNLKKLWVGGTSEDRYGRYGKEKRNPHLGNQLSILPDSVINLKELQNLGIGTNFFTEIPSVIFELKALTLLEANNNQITEIPQKIGNLTSLKTLSISKNELKSLPKTLNKLRNLTGLYLEHNELKNLPDSIVELENLHKLFLHHNNLKNLPESMENLTKLRVLNLSYTPLEEVPEGIFSLPNLKYLHLPSKKITPPKYYLKRVRMKKKSENDFLYIR
jgi:Leucine-rich repeat (LRR) protein